MAMSLSDFQSIIDSFSCDPEAGVCYRTLAFRGFPDYRVGDDGSVWSRRVYGSKIRRIGPWWLMKQKGGNHKRGHLYVDLFRSVGKPERWFVHSLVILAFVGPCPDNLRECRHWNDVPSDNRVENLLWGTRSQNALDAVRNGKILHGERSCRAKLTDDQVRNIRLLASQGVRHKVIAEQHGCGRHYVAKIVCREIWKHLV